MIIRISVFRSPRPLFENSLSLYLFLVRLKRYSRNLFLAVRSRRFASISLSLELGLTWKIR